MTTTQPRPRKPRKILTAIVLTVMVLVLFAGIAYEVIVTRGLPKIEGNLKLAGLHAPVSVVRDEQGVPHIVADSLHDLYMAQGFVQAQDRIFQMDLSRRQASGRLSEVFGEMAVEQDKMFRVLGLRRAAEASLAEASDEVMEVLEWFSAGVNAYIETQTLPVEFMLNGYAPEPWSPLDTLTIAKYMAHDLGGHWEDQAFRQSLLETFPEAEAMELFPSYPEGAPYIIGETVPVLSAFVAANVDRPSEWNGSNNWVVSGEMTASGMPLLSNDPHLSIASPSVWYQMHLKAEDIDVGGVIFGGCPGIIVGHNQHIAWGVTNTGPDVQDLYIERRNPDDPYEFLYMGEWERATVHQEDIRVKGGTVVPFEVIETRHGPVISDLAAASDADTVYALKWTAFLPTQEMQAVLDMNRATNWAEFEKGLESFQVPTQNFVFAGDDGTIAYKANGLIPIREGNGLLPVPGWTDEYEWTGYIPFDELPRVVNPDAGYVATANNKVISDDYPYHISHIFAQPYRQMRIVQLLEGREGLTAEDMRVIQGDVYDLHAEEFAPVFIKALEGESLTGKQRTALDIVAGWDYETTAESAGPLVFNLWYAEIVKALYNDRLTDEALALFQGKNQITDALLRRAASGEKSVWVDEAGGLTPLLLGALDTAVASIESRLGTNSKTWQWGKYHQVGFVHPLSSVAILRPIFNGEGRKPSPGSNVTVRAASWRQSDGLNNHGASWRFVIDLADEGVSRQIVAPGNSGHPRSPYYHGQFDRWIEGGLYETKTQDVTGKTLSLNP